MLTVASSILVLALVWLSQVDIQSLRIPDVITLPLIASGLAVNVFLHGASSLWLFALGAALGFLSLWLAATLYARLRGRPGLGLGDAKLLAAAGAWMGPMFLAPTVFIGALLGLAYAGFLRLRGQRISSQTIVPFGPFLSAAFFLLWCLHLAGVI
ncbi:MAG: A24 family peptidase [Devosia sp.]